ncbi:MAG: hypothetical protein K2N29_06490 [Ruminiclostridium sp.]|nr:hypothetical protein [Ruminiclostridium sp.]
MNRHRYDDIIDLPHHVSKKHPQMSLHDRAAQFSPFAALTGYEDAVGEAARLTDRRQALDEEQAAHLEQQLSLLTETVGDRPEIMVTYFLPDARKSGGKYVTVQGTLRRIDETEKTLIFTDGRRIAIRDILEISY